MDSAGPFKSGPMLAPRGAGNPEKTRLRFATEYQRDKENPDRGQPRHSRAGGRQSAPDQSHGVPSMPLRSTNDSRERGRHDCESKGQGDLRVRQRRSSSFH